MNFGKKLAIIGLIIFGIGVPSTATSMTMFGNAPHGLQNSHYYDGISVEPDQTKNIKPTLLGRNPIIIDFYVIPQGVPYHVTMTNYEYSTEVLNVVGSNSSQHNVEYARPGTYDIDFTNLGEETLYLNFEITDAKYGKDYGVPRIFLGFIMYVWYTVFFGGIVIGSIGAAIWKIRK